MHYNFKQSFLRILNLKFLIIFFFTAHFRCLSVFLFRQNLSFFRLNFFILDSFVCSVLLSICMYLCIYLSIYLSMCNCLSVYLSTCISVFLSICLFVYLSTCLPIYLSTCLYLYTCLHVLMSTWLPVYLSVYYDGRGWVW